MKTLRLAALLALTTGAPALAQSVTPGPFDCDSTGAMEAALTGQYGLHPVLALLADAGAPGQVNRVLLVWVNPANGHWVLTEADVATGVTCNLGWSFQGISLTEPFFDLLDNGALPRPGEAPASAPPSPGPAPLGEAL